MEMITTYEIGQRFERDGKTWKVVQTEPLGVFPNGNSSLDKLVFARNVRADNSLGQYRAVFWALTIPDRWHVN